MERSSQVISWLFLPLIMPVLALVFAMFTPAELNFSSDDSLYHLLPKQKLYYLINFTIYSFVLPAVGVLLLRQTKRVDSVELDNRKQRFAPIALTCISSILLLYLLFEARQKTHVSAHIFAMAASGFFVTIIFGLINLNTKISLHAGGGGMLVGFIVAYSLDQALLVVWPLALAILIAGLVISARLILNKHTPFQVLLGFSLATFITFVTDLFFVYLDV